MKLVVRTASGATYFIDTNERKWYRMKAIFMPWSQTRTACGEYWQLVHCQQGAPLVMTAAPLTPGTDVRLIETTPVDFLALLNDAQWEAGLARWKTTAEVRADDPGAAAQAEAVAGEARAADRDTLVVLQPH